MNNDKYNKDYFEKYEKKGKFGIICGEKVFWYGFRERFLKNWVGKGNLILEVGCGPGFFLK